MRIAILVVALIATAGCAAQRVAHVPRSIGHAEAREIIERVMFEQPGKHRPEAVAFAREYMVLRYGTVSRGRATAVPVGTMAIASGETVTTEAGKRLYFDTIAETRIYTKREWFVLDIVDASGHVMQRVYSRDETRARAFVDAIAALRGTI